MGKTTLSASLGVELAARGHRTLLVSTDPAHSLGDALDADLAGGWSDASEPFGSPRLHGSDAGDFSVVDVEFYALRPLW